MMSELSGDLLKAVLAVGKLHEPKFEVMVLFRLLKNSIFPFFQFSTCLCRSTIMLKSSLKF